MLRWLLFLSLACALGCASAPEVGPRPEDGLATARARAARAATPQEEARLRREILQRCLGLGWTQEASVEYLRLEVLHSGDSALLRELCLSTLRWALRDVDPARRLSALRVTQAAEELPSAERLALAEIGARDSRAEVRAGAVGVLASLDDPRSGALLVAACQDSEASVRRAGLAGVLARGLKVDEALRWACHDPSPGPRLLALETLAKRPLTTEFRSVLSDLLRHGDPATARAAALAWGAHEPADALKAWAARAPTDREGRALLAGLRYRAGGSAAAFLSLLNEGPLTRCPAEVCLQALSALRGVDSDQLADSRELEAPLLALVAEHPAVSVQAAALEQLKALGAASSRLDRALAKRLEEGTLAERRLALTWLSRVSRRRLVPLLRDPGLADLASARLETLLPREEWRAEVLAALASPARETLLPMALGLEGGRALALELLTSPTRLRLRSLALRSLLGNVVQEDLAQLLPHLAQDQDEDLYAAALALALLRRAKGKQATLPQ